jgi:hypothetical protein
MARAMFTTDASQGHDGSSRRELHRVRQEMNNIRALRRHQADSHMWRRLKEDRNQHYDDLKCACYTSPKHMARFKEQPKLRSSCECCGNPRQMLKGRERLTLQERRADGE